MAYTGRQNRSMGFGSARFQEQRKQYDLSVDKMCATYGDA